MDSSNTQSEGSQPPVPPKSPTMSSCRKKKNDYDDTFLKDVKEHIDEFIHDSMDEHKTCFKKTIQKVCDAETQNFCGSALFNFGALMIKPLALCCSDVRDVKGCCGAVRCSKGS